MTSAQTLYDKIWSAHVVTERSDGRCLLYIDQQLLHEVTSPQAFEGLRLAKREPWNRNANLATPDHNVPTKGRAAGIGGFSDPIARDQVIALDENCKAFGIQQFGLKDPRQGIVHVIGPEQGATFPGTTIVCGDSHTSTHGAFGALAQGIGTSEVEHVLATQCLLQKKAKNYRVCIDGNLPEGVFSKDLILAIIGKLGTAGATGHTIEYNGSAISNLSMEARMTVCNMSIEAGARAGIMGVDDITLKYLYERPMAPSGEMWKKAVKYWESLESDADAIFDSSLYITADDIKPQVTWGTSPEMVCAVDQRIPSAEGDNEDMERALEYMGLTSGQPITDIEIDRIFIGSCTNSRIEDLRIAASVLAGRKIHSRIKQALVVPGSGLIKKQAEEEGLADVFIKAGMEWRSAGCSMCLGMNPDRLDPEERCAATSNRNFEGRQGYRGRTHLVSPAMAAAAAVKGHFVDTREIL